MAAKELQLVEKEQEMAARGLQLVAKKLQMAVKELKMVAKVLELKMVAKVLELNVAKAPEAIPVARAKGKALAKSVEHGLEMELEPEPVGSPRQASASLLLGLQQELAQLKELQMAHTQHFSLHRVRKVAWARRILGC